MRHLATFGSSLRSVGRPISNLAHGPGTVTLAALALVVAGLPRPCQADDAAWQAIARFRANLEADSPLTAEFTQTYLPTGWSEGDSESGKLAIALPACLRWDYVDPFPKSFLLCNEDAWYWNPGETVGQRYSVDQQQAGLDFFLMPASTLEERYDASLETDDRGRLWITLVPVEPTEDVVQAGLSLDPDSHRLLTLNYVDIEGNRTDFEIHDYRGRQTLDDQLFEPPPGVDWQEPEP